MVYCRTLGPIDVTVGGQAPPAPLRWRKNVGLLVYLACSPRRTRSRDHLIGLFWGDKSESAARHSLNEALRVLRRACGDDAVETTVDSVRLSAQAVRLDCEDFQARAATGDWAGACELVGGDFLEGFTIPGGRDFDDWRDAQQRAWRQRTVEALCRRGAELLALGDVSEAAQIARRALDLDTLSQAACRLLMRTLVLSGERAGALEQYEAFERRLHEQLGIAPDDETRNLARRVRSSRAGQAAGKDDDQDVRSLAGPLVGRETELSGILAAWETCREARRASLILIQGDDGSGKTRLLDEVIGRARLDEAETILLRAVETDAGTPNVGVHTLLRELGEAPSEEDNADLANLVAALRRRVASAPILIGIDAAHWLDRASLLALQPLLRDLAQAPIAVVLTLAKRPLRMEIEALRARIGRDLAGVVVKLGPLSTDDLRTLARRALPEWDADQVDRIARRVAVDSAGLPLLAVELLHAVRHGLDMGALTSAWPEPSRTLDHTMPGQLPDALTAAIRVGFRKLGAGARDVLVALAVVGERVTADSLMRATGTSESEVDDALDELEWHRWITSERRGYAFSARIVRDVVLREMVTATRRNRIEARIAKEPAQ
jgi:DNA-binding SARP family transcriptional activator